MRICVEEIAPGLYLLSQEGEWITEESSCPIGNADGFHDVLLLPSTVTLR